MVHLIIATGIQVLDGKVKAVKEFHLPENVKQLRSFLGLTNYYRRFIQGYSTIVAPLTKLTHKNTEFIWSTTCDKSFNELKTEIN